MSQKASPEVDTTKKATRATSSTARPMLMAWRFGRMMGLPDMRPSSLAKAIIEPVKVRAPMAAPIDISTRLWPWMAPGTPMPKAWGA